MEAPTALSPRIGHCSQRCILILRHMCPSKRLATSPFAKAYIQWARSIRPNPIIMGTVRLGSFSIPRWRPATFRNRQGKNKINIVSPNVFSEGTCSPHDRLFPYIIETEMMMASKGSSLITVIILQNLFPVWPRGYWSIWYPDKNGK